MMKQNWVLCAIAIFFFSNCKTTPLSQLEANNNQVTRRPPLLPDPSRAGGKTPWGGARSEKWRPEAIIANGASNLAIKSSSKHCGASPWQKMLPP